MSKVLVDRELLENLVSLWAAKGYGKVGSPGHCHEKPGIWDKGNGPLAGKPCAECAIYDAARAILAQPAEAEGVGAVQCPASHPAECYAPWTQVVHASLVHGIVRQADALSAALSAVTAERDGEAESCEQWRALALQFDRHRMSALAHLKMVVAGQEGALDACRDFLAAPPVPGHEITAEIDQLRAEVEALRKAVEPLEPVHGDALPPIGSKVLIHLSSSDAWVEHTVAGYYARGALNGDVSLHRVFVRVRDSDGYLNARLLKDVRTVANSTNG